MSEIVLAIDHPVSLAEARRRVQKLIQSVRAEDGRWVARWTAKDRLAIETDWNGTRIRGKVVLKPGSVEVTLELPWAWQFLGGPVRRTIEETVRQVLDVS